MPITPEQDALLNIAFRPHAPIEDPGSFFGREPELARVRSAISDPGLHVVIYGEPGSGKTSLANVATLGAKGIKVFCEENANFSGILRDAALEMQRLDPTTLTFDATKDTITKKGVVLPIGNMTGNHLLSLLPEKESSYIIFDELDRVKNPNAIASLAEVAKNVATKRPNVTLIFVGVADVAGALLRGHASNFRNIEEVQLDRMQKSELLAILKRGETILNIKFSDAAKDAILDLCDNTPYYLHLLAKGAARAALDAGLQQVEIYELAKGAIEAANGAHRQLRNTYEFAIASKVGTTIYHRVIWALAELPSKNNNLSEVIVATNNIFLDTNDRQLKNTAVAAAMRRLCKKEKGEIIYQPAAGVYSFKNPLMKGFVRTIRYRQ